MIRGVKPVALILLLAAALAAVLLSLPIREEPTWLETEVPGLSPDLARLLLHGDDEDLCAFSREAGQQVLNDAYVKVDDAIRGKTAQELQRVSHRLLPVLTRISTCLARDFCGENYLDECRFRDTLTSEDAFLRMELELRAEAISPPDTSMTESERIAELKTILQQLESLGDRWRIGLVAGSISRCYERMGDHEGKFLWLRRSAGYLRDAQYTYMLCQVLPILGIIYHEQGNVDSLWACWREAEDLAKQCRFPEHAARMKRFRAVYYNSVGRHALAEALYEEAPTVARRLGSGPGEVRFLLDAMENTVRLGAWSKLGDQIERARFLMRSTPWKTREQHWSFYNCRLKLLEARYCMAVREHRRGEQIYRDLVSRMLEDWEVLYYAVVYLAWAEDLVREGRDSEALEKISLGLEWAERNGQVGYPSLLRMLKAQTEARLDLWEACETTLQVLENRGALETPPRRIHALSLRAGARLHQGRSGEAKQLLREAVIRFADLLQSSDGSQQAFLTLHDFEELREMLLEVVTEDTEALYRMDLAWKKLVAFLGVSWGEWRESYRQGAAEEILALLDSPGHRLPPPERPSPGTDVWCFTNSNGDLIRTVVGSNGFRSRKQISRADRIQKMLRTVLQEVSRDPGGDTLPPGIQRYLEDLGQVLVPPIPSGTQSVLVISQAGHLGFPFEILDTLPGPGYEPLLSRVDVAYGKALLGAETVRDPGARPLIVIDPVLPPEIRLSHSFLQRLPRAREEGRRMASLLNGAEVLEGSAATKRNLMARWENASLIYVAGHVVRNPESPYLSFIPLAVDEPGTARRDDAYLDAIDVRGADLRACEMVVLSTCSSGSPYVSRTSSAPGFGDAFLDAGAGLVIQTFWDIRDESAWSVMSRFQDLWAVEGEDPIRSLSEARRSFMRDGDGRLRHPFHWGAYHLRLGQIPVRRDSD